MIRKILAVSITVATGVMASPTIAQTSAGASFIEEVRSHHAAVALKDSVTSTLPSQSSALKSLSAFLKYTISKR